LNTGNEPAELASLAYLVESLNPGGVIVIHDYGWVPSTAPYDAIAARLHAQIFALPTGQGVLMKARADC
jgi:hypothetical protein